MKLNLSHDHVALRVVDYDAAIAWYTSKLDFTVDQEWPFGDMKLAYISNGTAKVEILGASTADPQAQPTDLNDTFGHEGPHYGRDAGSNLGRACSDASPLLPDLAAA